MSALNPNHKVVQTLHDHWYKIAAALLVKFGGAEVVITGADINAMSNMFGGEEPCIVAHDKADGLHLKIISRSDGEKLARQAGGLPS